MHFERIHWFQILTEFGAFFAVLAKAYNVYGSSATTNTGLYPLSLLDLGESDVRYSKTLWFRSERKVGGYQYISKTKWALKLKNSSKKDIVKRNKCTSDHFVAEPIVIAAKKDGSIELAMNAKPMNTQIFKNQYQMPNLLEQLDVAAQIINADIPSKVWLTSLDLKYAFSQLSLCDLVSSHTAISVSYVGNQQVLIVLKPGLTV